MKQKKNLKFFKATAALSTLLIGLTIGIVFMQQFQEPIAYNLVNSKHDEWVVRAESNPGAGKTGFLMMVFRPHNSTMPAWSTTAGDVRWNNSFYTTGTWTNYSYAMSLNTSATKNIPYNSKLDIWFKVRVNASDGQNSTSKYWNFAWQRCNITCSGLGIAANTVMKQINITANANFIWMAYFVNGSAGSWGYTVAKGQKINISTWQLQVYR